MSLLYHAYVYLEFLILACTIYILAPSDEDGEIGVEDLYLKDGVEQDRTAWEKETEIYRAIKNERGL